MTTEYNLDTAFPVADAGVTPFGSRILVQIRNPRTTTKGGIILTQDVKDTESDNTQVAKIIALGALAFKNRTTMVTWPEGDWVAVGDYVRVPRHGGDKWSVDTQYSEYPAKFALYNDLDLVAKITGDPLVVKSYVF